MKKTSTVIQRPTYYTSTVETLGQTRWTLPQKHTYLRGNYILTGPKSEIDTLVQEAHDEQGIASSLITELDLGYLEPLFNNCENLPWYDGMEAGDGLVMRLYKLSKDTPAEHPSRRQEQEMVEFISQRSADRHVYVDLDYVMDGICGDPWTGEGGPWAELAPYLPPQAGYLTVAQQEFQSQWAFGEARGIGLYGPQGRTVAQKGEGVRIGVFDTSPEPEPGLKPYPWAEPELGLKIEQLTPIEYPQDPSVEKEINYLIETPFATDDHGLFVAGLIHGVAPLSDIRLYRVLDDKREGDLFTLNYALHTFIRETLQDRSSLRGAVINLSLGSFPLPMIQSTSTAQIRQSLKPVSLHTLLTAAHCFGIVVAAAAGNSRSESVILSQNPAQSPDILAVAASTNSRIETQACFSQNGNVLAPGGNGTAPGCRPPGRADRPDQWLMSLASKPESQSTSLPQVGHWLRNVPRRKQQIRIPPQDLFRWAIREPSGYAHSAGTSFSTPLVSGLAALIFQAGARTTPEGRQWISSEVIHESIKESGAGRKGIAHAPTAIEKALATTD